MNTGRLAIRYNRGRLFVGHFVVRYNGGNWVNVGRHKIPCNGGGWFVGHFSVCYNGSKLGVCGTACSTLQWWQARWASDILRYVTMVSSCLLDIVVHYNGDQLNGGKLSVCWTSCSTLQWWQT